ncbi:MAG: hypothetical protein ACRDIF_04545, partial [Actinomycetota bacterium]
RRGTALTGLAVALAAGRYSRAGGLWGLVETPMGQLQTVEVLGQRGRRALAGLALALATAAIAAPAFGASGFISTVAGTGSSGYSGDGGPAASARMKGPRTLAVDSEGNIFIADTMNHRIRKVDSSGIITTVAGTGSAGYSGDGGPATKARLYWPHDVAVDASGNLYIADSANQVIRKVDPSGIITTVAGTGSAGYSGDGGPATGAKLNEPRGGAVDAAGNIYISDRRNHRIRKVDSSGIITTVAGTGSAGYGGDGGPATAAKLDGARGVGLDGSGNIYIADTGNHRIRRVEA